MIVEYLKETWTSSNNEILKLEKSEGSKRENRLK